MANKSWPAGRIILSWLKKERSRTCQRNLKLLNSCGTTTRERPTWSSTLRYTHTHTHTFTDLVFCYQLSIKWRTGELFLVSRWVRRSWRRLWRDSGPNCLTRGDSNGSARRWSFRKTMRYQNWTSQTNQTQTDHIRPNHSQPGPDRPKQIAPDQNKPRIAAKKLCIVPVK